ncbi:hypothetical protein LIER_36468 [Lithospermum erythrorhizon]|uniref:Calmodulin binding protein n=1 Tax=Lithospermum erythrorhizon TaxID=34254 RepID=A0AAV3P7S6_LITER
MGANLSCLFSVINDLDSKFESFIVRSIGFRDDDENAADQSASYDSQESEMTMLKSFSCNRMIIEGSLSFKGGELETEIILKAPILSDSDMVRSPNKACKLVEAKLYSPINLLEEKSPRVVHESGDERHMAAIRLQKTYKSFRTRRQLADCAVLVEQRWWKLLDSAELKSCSVSFFDIGKPETAISRWSRARTRVAKVGKGLSKDEKARKLALQHWLEAIDHRHRYGHNLQFYYVNWLQCESKQPFFYWLDIGEGKEINLEKCPRFKLQQQCIKYLGPSERQKFEVVIENGRLKYKQSGELLDTRGGPEDTKWIFVLSVSKNLYVGQKKKGTFQHSSFLAGGAALSAGRLVVEDGVLKAVWPHSGHYLPTEENFEEFMSFLEQLGVDLSIVQKAPTDEDEFTMFRKENSSLHITMPEPEISQSREQANHRSLDEERPETSQNSGLSRRFQSKISSIEIPKRENIFEEFRNEEKQAPTCSTECVQPPIDGYESAEESISDTEHEYSKHNLFDEDQEDEYEKPVPREKILKRINSHKGMKSYQLARQLSCRWTTGAGPRIGCVRDYPSELQVRALEEVHLSPRSRSTSSTPRKSSRLSPIVSTNLCRGASVGKSPLASEHEIVAEAVTDQDKKDS